MSERKAELNTQANRTFNPKPETHLSYGLVASSNFSVSLSLYCSH